MESKYARNAWLLVGAGVAAIDWAAPPGQTMSEGVDRAIEKHPVATIVAVGAVALHLLNVLPPQIDPIHQLAERIRHE